MVTGNRDRIGDWRGRFGGVGRDCPFENGTGEKRKEPPNISFRNKDNPLVEYL
jgi:hypothetical protein